MRARDPFATVLLALSLTNPAGALPVVRIAQAVTDHHSPATVASDTADYIRNSAIGDLFEISAAKVAQRTSHDDDVLRFSRMIIDDQTANRNALATTLKQDEFAMTLPPSLDAPHNAIVMQLQDATVANFNANYIQQQIMANKSALRVQASYARNGRDLGLRQFAGQTIPKIRMHLAVAEHIFQHLSAKTANVHG